MSDSPALTFSSTRGRWVLVATILGSGIAGLTATVVNVALPTIGRDLDTATAGLQWILNGYLLPLAALILLGALSATASGAVGSFSSAWSGSPAPARSVASLATSPPWWRPGPSRAWVRPC